MKKAIVRTKGRLPVYLLFGIGFLAGVLIPNIIWKMEWHQRTVSSFYLLSTFTADNMNNREYFFEVLCLRGGTFLFFVFCGCTFLGVPLSVFGTILEGIRIGGLLTMSILQFGLNGGLIGAGLLIPQYIIYFPCMFFLMQEVYRHSREIWQGHGLFLPQIYRYLGHMLLCWIMVFVGVMFEVYCNPIITEMLTKSLKIF